MPMCEMIDLTDYKRGRGRLKKNQKEVIRHNIRNLILTQDKIRVFVGLVTYVCSFGLMRRTC